MKTRAKDQCVTASYFALVKYVSYILVISCDQEYLLIVLEA